MVRVLMDFSLINIDENVRVRSRRSFVVMLLAFRNERLLWEMIPWSRHGMRAENGLRRLTGQLPNLLAYVFLNVQRVLR
jgi:hypothetical protein